MSHRERDIVPDRGTNERRWQPTDVGHFAEEIWSRRPLGSQKASWLFVHTARDENAQPDMHDDFNDALRREWNAKACPLIN